MDNVIDFHAERAKRYPRTNAGVGYSSKFYEPIETPKWKSVEDVLRCALNDIKSGAVAPGRVYIAFHQTWENEDTYPFYSFGFNSQMEETGMIHIHANLTPCVVEREEG